MKSKLKLNNLTTSNFILFYHTKSKHCKNQRNSPPQRLIAAKSDQQFSKQKTTQKRRTFCKCRGGSQSAISPLGNKIHRPFPSLKLPLSGKKKVIAVELLVKFAKTYSLGLNGELFTCFSSFDLRGSWGWGRPISLFLPSPKVSGGGGISFHPAADGKSLLASNWEGCCCWWLRLCFIFANQTSRLQILCDWWRVVDAIFRRREGGKVKFSHIFI